MWSAAHAADQTWVDGSSNSYWSLSDLNWDAGASAWMNGNSAVFTGGVNATGSVVEVEADLSVGNLTFQAGGYEVADTNSNGALTLENAPVIGVANAGDTAVISESLAGVAFTKSGGGVLQLTAANSFTGVLTVASGTLRLDNNVPSALGAAGDGNGTVVQTGATLDFNGAYWPAPNSGAVNVDEDIVVSGAGTDGNGALINTGNGIFNGGFRNLTLLGDTVIGGPVRLDLGDNGSFVGNGHTLTKKGGMEMAVTRDMSGSPIVIDEGTYTIQHDLALGDTAYDTMVNGGNLHCWGDHVIPERIVFNGGTIVANWDNNTFTLSGHLTFNTTVGATTWNTGRLVFSGQMDGSGGLNMYGNTPVYFLGSSTTYSGATTIGGGVSLYVGKSDQDSGNLGTGPVVNNGLLYFDRSGTYAALPGGITGSGNTYIRYGGAVTLDGGASTNNSLHIGKGNLTFTNGASLYLNDAFGGGDRLGCNYPADPTNVTTTVNVYPGSEISANHIYFGDGFNVDGGGMNVTFNQHGGSVRTRGCTAENNGMRLGHWPQANGVYNMMGGTLTVGGDYELCIATDGAGYFHQTGGEVFATRVMLNEREGGGGYGHLKVEGGVLNIGSLSGLVGAVSNGISADLDAPYLVEYGGHGGTVRAVTNVYSELNAALYGAGPDAVTFDTAGFAIHLSGALSGEGGLNKAGAGELVLSGANTYTGATAVAGGTLRLGGPGVLPGSAVALAGGSLLDLGGLTQTLRGVGGAGAVVNGALLVSETIEPGAGGSGTLTLSAASSMPGGALVATVTSGGSCGLLRATGDLSLAGMSLRVSNPDQLTRGRRYTVAACDGTLSRTTFAAVSLPSPWYAYYDWANNAVQLRSEVGTAILLH